MTAYENSDRQIELLFNDLSYASKKTIVDDLIKSLESQQYLEDKVKRKELMSLFSNLPTIDDQRYVCKKLVTNFNSICNNRPAGMSMEDYESRLKLSDILRIKTDKDQ